jgi:hypothetical protein
MASGPESPWFPGTAVYRQAADGTWDGALAKLADDLSREHMATPAASFGGLVTEGPRR